MEVAAGIVAPEGYHYHGQPPVIDGTTVSKLARFISDEEAMDQKSRYSSLWVLLRNEPRLLGAPIPVVSCLVCGNELKCASNQNGLLNFTNFFKHLQNKHPTELTPKDQKVSKDVVAAVVVPVGLLNPAVWAAKPKDNIVQKSKKAVRDAIAEMCLTDGKFPFTLVENEHMRSAIRRIVKLHSNDVVCFPSADTVRRRVIQLIEEFKLTDLAAFRLEMGRRGRILLAITNDSTTSRAKHNYTCLTGSIITPGTGTSKWSMREIFFGCSPNKPGERHTALAGFQQLVRAIFDYLDLDEATFAQFSIEDHLSSGTFDCGSNTPRVLLGGRGVDSLRCCGHRLNTLQEHMDKLAEWAAALAPMHGGMEMVRKSVQNTHLLDAIQAAEGSATILRCIDGAATRWQYDTRVARRGDKLYVFMIKMDVTKMYFKDAAAKEKWNANLSKWGTETRYYVAFLLPLLERIEFWTVFSEQAHSVTISFSRYLVQDLLAFTGNLQAKLEVEYTAHNLPLEIAQSLRTIFDTFLTEVGVIFAGVEDNLLLQVAEILDFRTAVPTNQTRKDQLPDIPPNYRHPSGIYVISKLLEFYDYHRLGKMLLHGYGVAPAVIVGAGGDGGAEAAGGGAGVGGPGAAAVAGAVAVAFDPFAGDAAPEVADDLVRVNRTKFEAEVIAYERALRNDYMLVPGEGKRLNRDPLVLWWPTLLLQYPMLSLLAVHVLEIPISVAGSERFFSRLGNVVPKNRTRLDAKFAGDIVLHSMRANRSNAEKKPLVIPLFGKLDEDVVRIEDWDDADDDDYDSEEEDQLESDGEADDDYDNEGEDGEADDDGEQNNNGEGQGGANKRRRIGNRQFGAYN